MLNRYLRVLSAQLFAATLLSTGLSTATSAKTKLVYSTYLTANHVLNTKAVKPFFDEVAKATNGSLIFDLVAGGSLSGPRTTLNAIKNGVVDSGVIINVYTAGELPITDISSDDTLVDDDPRVVTAAETEFVLKACAECKKEWANKNMVPLSAVSATPYHLLCTKAVHSLADLKGVKVRAASSSAALIQALGATPVNVAVTEIYEALQRGQVDCTLGPTPHLKNYALADIAKHVNTASLGTTHGIFPLVINKHVWDSLSQADRNAITEGLPHLVRNSVQAYIEEAASIEENAKKEGVVFDQASSDLVDAIHQQSEANLDRVRKQARLHRVSDPDKYLNEYHALIKKWDKIIHVPNYSFDQYERDLKREIFTNLTY